MSPLLQSVAWDDAKALLLTFRLPAKAASEEKMAIDIARVAELQNILDTATDGILITSNDGKIESLNGPAEALFGVNQSQFVGKALEELFAKESRRTIAEYLGELKEPGVAGLINNGREAIGLHAKGGLVPLFITLGKIGRQEKYCAVLRDITPWKKAEEELVTARRAAETASEQKSEFLARVSHEIRTPLNAIIGFSDVMIEERFGPIENERYRGYLRDINRSGVHVLDLINDLLDISKIEAGKMELTYEAVDLNQLVSETVALLQPQANAERIIIRTSLSRAVPRVVADARSIRQIILNLVSNAIKFTPANGQVIVSTVYEGNGEVVLRVRDTGRGMTEREIEHAMKPFHQVHVTDERRGQGTGLGLPLTKAPVEANRAYFDLESTPGEGTIAHVHFPTQRVLAD
jgi:PAS domain S-box-containing protein